MSYKLSRSPLNGVTISLLMTLIVSLGACGGNGNSGQSEGVAAIGVDNRPIPEAGLSLLFIGNSLTYTNDLPGMLERMLIIAGVEVGTIEAVALPNHGLPDHWFNTNARQRIGVGGWDVVILQQGPSATEGRPYLLEYTPLFAQEISQINAQTALYMVWPSKARFCHFSQVSASYTMAARSVDGLLFPAGEAWLAAWQRNPALKLYSSDNFHPSKMGTYLAALVMFEQLTGLDINELPNVIPAVGGDIALSPDVSKVLKDAAKQANAEHALVYPQ